jgi:hypothetical protein
MVRIFSIQFEQVFPAFGQLKIWATMRSYICQAHVEGLNLDFQ